MTEETGKRKRITVEELVGIVTGIIDVKVKSPEFGEMTFGVRPITWEEAARIEDEASKYDSRLQKDRYRIMMTVRLGVVEPVLGTDIINKLPPGVITELAVKIGQISNLTTEEAKNESKSS